MRRHSTLISATTIFAAAALTAVTVSACSSSSTSPSASPSAAAPSPSTSAPVTEPGGNTSVLPPIMITKAEDVKVKVRDTLVVSTPNVTRVSTDNAEVLAVSQPRADATAQFNGGAVVLAPGKAVLTVYGGVTNSEMYSVNVTATQ